MKRNLIFIILIMMFFCLTGCSEEKEIDKDLEEDIKILSKLSMEELGSGEKGEQILSHFINVVRLLPEHFTFYTGKIDYSKTYVLCAYIEKEKAVCHYHRFTVPNYYDDVTWVKYEKEEDIKVKHKGLILTDTFIVYSITIYKDILTNKEYNQTYKLYYDKYYESSYTYRKGKPEVFNPEGEYLISGVSFNHILDYINRYYHKFDHIFFEWGNSDEYMQKIVYEDNEPYVIIKKDELIGCDDLQEYIIKEEYSYEKDGEIINTTQYKIKLEEIVKGIERKLNEKDNK